jgi:hypothetical protein
VRTFLTFLVGDRPSSARPVLAISDAELVKAALQAVLDRLTRSARAEAFGRGESASGRNEEAVDGNGQ